MLIILLLSFLWSCTSCNSSNPEADQDSGSLPDNTDQSDEKTDNDSVTDESDEVDEDIDDAEELADVDYQGAEECPDLIDAKFPYYNDDLSIHFCRKCDKPTVKDPQCVENLWKDAAAELYAASPESECENGYPCEMPELKPRTQTDWDETGEGLPPLPYRPHECDLVLEARSPHTIWATDSSVGAIKHFDISNGKVGLFLSNIKLDYKKYRTYAKAMEFNPETGTYRALSPDSLETGAYNKGCMLHLINNFHFYDSENNVRYYLAHSCNDGTRRVVYPSPIRYVSYTPALSEKWAIANIEVEDGDGSSTMYAKVGEWKWTKLMEGLSYQPVIVNDKAAFYTDSFKGYYCDLSKNPKSVDECILVNENETEEIRYPLINEDDETEVLYESDIAGVFTVKKLKLDNDGKKTYSTVLTKFESTDDYWKPFGFGLRKVAGDMIQYNEFLMSTDGYRDSNACFHNRKTGKSVCMKKVEGMEKFLISYTEWEGKWMAYQFFSATTQCVRDLDCYCEKEGICPFEE
jgi:hypothetical protein